MKEIKLQNNTYLFVECEEDSHSHTLSKYKTHAVLHYKRTFTDGSEWSNNIGGANVILLDFEIISTTKDITEEQAVSIVLYTDIESHKLFVGGLFKNYNSKHPSYYCKTAKESLQSLIQANGLDINKNYLILLKP